MRVFDYVMDFFVPRTTPYFDKVGCGLWGGKIVASFLFGVVLSILAVTFTSAVALLMLPFYFLGLFTCPESESEHE